MKGKLIAVFVGVFIVAVSWVPLLIVAARDRYAMPVGLGLLAFAGSFVGGVLVDLDEDVAAPVLAPVGLVA